MLATGFARAALPFHDVRLTTLLLLPLPCVTSFARENITADY